MALLLTLPGRFLSAPPKLESYTVDLVAPDVVGGTNLVPGGGKAKAPSAEPRRRRLPSRRRRRRAPAAKPAAEAAAEAAKDP